MLLLCVFDFNKVLRSTVYVADFGWMWLRLVVTGFGWLVG
jgi:hypothetical protein